MDALLRRPLTAAAVLISAGCGSTETAKVSGYTASSALARGQAPGGLQPPAAIVPLYPSAAPAPAQPAVATPAPAAAPIVAASLSTSGEPTPEKGTPRIRAVAVVGADVVITDDEVWQLVRQRAAEYARLTGSEREKREKEIFQDSLRTLIERELILDDFLGKIRKNRPQLIPELTDQAKEAAEKQIAGFKKANQFKSEEDFNRALKAMGLSATSLSRQFERNALLSMYMGQLLRDLGKKVNLGQIDAYYRSHPAEFQAPDAVKWQHLFVAYSRFPSPADAQKYADGLLAQAKGGADLAKLATEYGHGDSKLRQGDGAGEKRGEIQPRELEPTVFSLAAGQLSGIVPTATGLHVVKVLEREYAGTRPFDEKTQTAIRMKLAGELQKTEYDKLIEELWRKTTVRIVSMP